ncbi:MAG TPA: PQQ-binding-like beta-propeller repeat protein [Azospirillum sp.]|nr:PQQ-binding-like beta-propeller repeat protein [Azospirillum sp.]
MTRTNSHRAALLSAPLLGLLLAGCDTVGDWFSKTPSPPLPGERVSVLIGDRKVEPDPRLAGEAVVLPAAQTNEAWPQAGGNPDHAMGHLSLASAPILAWSTSVGSGSSSSQMMLSTPVVAQGRIYAMDADTHVAALDERTGRQLWRVDVRPEKRRGDSMGGGVVFADGRLFAATGYGEVLALDPSNGAIAWRKRVPGPVRGAPTVVGGSVFVLTLDNQTIALSAADGAVKWNHAGILESAGLLGSASPAADGTLLVVPYSSGELFGLRIENGRIAWQDSLAAIRRGGALSSMADIRGLPVLDRGQVYAIGHSGRMVALDQRMGARLWEAEVGGAQTPWLAGDYLFVVDNDNEVLAITRKAGSVRWVSQLEKFKDPKDKTGTITWAGPVLAGNRLWLTGSHGVLVTLDPTDGKENGRYSLPAATYLPPIVANNTLYVLSDNGTLSAFR